mmetsp:Transcript_9731/g.36528  ORF Transcript_9731/g.36528 Transcript_9731/m.36528 type:complete len:215 (-) Transcript_9731:432-1076(-)
MLLRAWSNSFWYCESSRAAMYVPSKSTSALKTKVLGPTHCDCRWYTFSMLLLFSKMPRMPRMMEGSMDTPRRKRSLSMVSWYPTAARSADTPTPAMASKCGAWNTCANPIPVVAMATPRHAAASSSSTAKAVGSRVCQIWRISGVPCGLVLAKLSTVLYNTMPSTVKFRPKMAQVSRPTSCSWMAGSMRLPSAANMEKPAPAQKVDRALTRLQK